MLALAAEGWTGLAGQCPPVTGVPPSTRSAYLLEEEGSETAWTMSVDSASRTLVRNSFFLAPGQPEIKEGARFSTFTGLTGHRAFPVTVRSVALIVEGVWGSLDLSREAPP